MGRTSDDEGETSTKVYKTDDVDDRPLKKARYVWQIKGKYHLKKADEEKHSCYTPKASSNDECSSLISPCNHATCDGGTCKLDVNIIETTESSSVLCGKVANEEILPDNREKITITDCETDITVNNYSHECDSFHITNKPDWPTSVSPVFLNTRPSTSWQLRKWQARQVARCFVDNTINRVLEDMGFVPLPVDADDILEEFPMTESENDEGLEDEAVLMAIHRHGLQRTEGGQIESVNTVKTGNNEKVNSSDVESHPDATSIPCACSCTSKSDSTFENLDPFHQRPILWDQLELDHNRLVHSPFTNKLKNNDIIQRWFSDGSLFSSVISSDSSCDSEIKSCGESIASESLKDNSSEHSNEVETKIEDNLCVKVDELAERSDNKNSSSFEHSDFLDKAVAVAIQKKGLSKLSCSDYG